MSSTTSSLWQNSKFLYNPFLFLWLQILNCTYIFMSLRLKSWNWVLISFLPSIQNPEHYIIPSMHCLWNQDPPFDFHSPGLGPHYHLLKSCPNRLLGPVSSIIHREADPSLLDQLCFHFTLLTKLNVHIFLYMIISIYLAYLKSNQDLLCLVYIFPHPENTSIYISDIQHPCILPCTYQYPCPNCFLQCEIVCFGELSIS